MYFPFSFLLLPSRELCRPYVFQCSLCHSCHTIIGDAAAKSRDLGIACPKFGFLLWLYSVCGKRGCYSCLPSSFPPAYAISSSKVGQSEWAGGMCSSSSCLQLCRKHFKKHYHKEKEHIRQLSQVFSCSGQSPSIRASMFLALVCAWFSVF